MTEEIKEKTVPEKIDEIHSLLVPKNDKNKKNKEIKIPPKGRVSKAKAQKGWISIMKIEENRNVAFEKQQIGGEVFQTKDGIFHATNGSEIYFWKGKPLLVQPSWRQNPAKDITQKIEEDNNVYGQKPIIARIQSGVVENAKKKGGFGGIGLILAIVVGGYLLLHFVLKVF